MSFSFNFEVTGAENDLGATQKTPEKEENKLIRTLAGFEVVLPTAEQEHMHENLERSVLDLTSTKIHFFVGGQIEHLLSGDLQKVTNENLDLVPTVYEGGMKVWECSLDLAEYVESHLRITEDNTVLELGCGAGLPGLIACIRGAAVHFQDYNRQVLELVTIPNAFDNINEKVYAKCRFMAGDWSTVLDHLEECRYDIILTSETIYNTEGYQNLIKIFKRSLKNDGIVLVAAKTCYFGLGGGTRQFEASLEADGTFESRVVFVTDSGVQREILELRRKAVEGGT